MKKLFRFLESPRIFFRGPKNISLSIDFLSEKRYNIHKVLREAKTSLIYLNAGKRCVYGFDNNK